MTRAAHCLLLAILVVGAFVLVRCAECDPTICRLEDNCLCMSDQPPGNLSAAAMPQFVMLTFDDAVNEQNMGFYRELLAPGRRRNLANGCNVAATFFVSAGHTDYSCEHELHSVGSEIALHSITHLDNLTYWRTLDVAGWEAEFVGERHLLRDYALIPERDMVGARAPFLEIGHGEGYRMMRKHGFLYDSSVVLEWVKCAYELMPIALANSHVIYYERKHAAVACLTSHMNGPTDGGTHACMQACYEFSPGNGTVEC